MACTWNKRYTEILLTKTTGQTLVLKQNTCIRFAGRDLGVRIVSIPQNSEGPIGFTYLPWRGKRWATFSFNLNKGDLRRLVCYPTGLDHQVWGQHIDWDTVEIIENPELRTLEPNSV